jgi:hypothetical protein
MKRKSLDSESHSCHESKMMACHITTDRFKRLFIILCLSAGLFHTSFAQENQPQELKTTAVAIKHSVYGTAVPVVIGAISLAAMPRANDEEEALLWLGIGVGAVGLVSGPGFGHAYSKAWGRFFLGSLIRTVAGMAIIGGILGDDPSGMDWGPDNSSDGKAEDTLSLIGGGIVYLLSVIWDIRSLDASVQRYNQKHAGTAVSISPAYNIRENAPGLVVRLTF